MKKENELLGNFQVEELEKRYEMGWKKKPVIEISSEIPEDQQLIKIEFN